MKAKKAKKVPLAVVRRAWAGSVNKMRKAMWKDRYGYYAGGRELSLVGRNEWNKYMRMAAREFAETIVKWAGRS